MRLVFTVAALGGSASLATAGTIDQISNYVGHPTAEHSAALVIDFNDGKSPQSYGWVYRFDGPSVSTDKLFRDVIASDPRLFAKIGDTSFGPALFGVGYDADLSNGFGTTKNDSFGASGIATGTTTTSDGGLPNFAGDRYAEGWNTGFWGEYLATSDPFNGGSWGYGNGLSYDSISDGQYLGLSFAPGFADSTPDNPVPEPATLAAIVGGAGLLLRRRRRAIAAGALASVAAPALASAYVYDPNDFATSVVASSGFATSGTYGDPAATLGRPTLTFNNSTNPNVADLRRAKLIESVYNVGPGGEKLLTSVASGQSFTVKMGRPVTDDAANPYGVDFIVYGNAAYGGGGAFVSDSTNLNNVTLGSAFSEPMKISVSPDNVRWYTYASGPFGDTEFPTNSYLWDATNAKWSDVESDPTKPLDPTATAVGKNAATVLASIYDGGAGGTGFDLKESGFDSIQYIRVTGVDGFANGEIDAFADVSPAPEPATLAAIVGLGGVLVGRRRR